MYSPTNITKPPEEAYRLRGKAKILDNGNIIVDQTKPGVVTIVCPKGATGDPGPAGPAGPKGDRGNTGAQGPQGIRGPAGPQGIQGPKGNKGDKGDAGPAPYISASAVSVPYGTPASVEALEVLPGDYAFRFKIPNGATGPKGDTGDTGAQGPKGDKGDRGQMGPQGIQGPPPTLQVSATTIAEGSQATVSIVEGTEPGDYTINFGIPKGETGPQGPAGVEEVIFDDTATFEEIAEASDAGKKCYWYGTIIYGSGLSSMSATVTLPLTSIVNNAMQKSAVFNGVAKLSGMGGQAFASVVSTCAGATMFTPTPGWSHSADPLQYKLTAGNNITISGNTISAEGCLVLDYEEGNEQAYYGGEINNIIDNNKSVIVRAVLPDGNVAYYTPCVYESSEGIMYFSCTAPIPDVPPFIYLDSDGYFSIYV